MEQEIMNYFVMLTPAITSIISVIAALIIAIKRVKSIDAGYQKEAKQLNNRMNGVLTENAELKQEIKKLVRTVRHVEESIQGTTRE